MCLIVCTYHMDVGRLFRWIRIIQSQKYIQKENVHWFSNHRILNARHLVIFLPVVWKIICKQKQNLQIPLTGNGASPCIICVIIIIIIFVRFSYTLLVFLFILFSFFFFFFFFLGGGGGRGGGERENIYIWFADKTAFDTPVTL